MRVGLFGGTFDPIHWGHLRSAEEVREAFNLDRVLFVPSADPPHKKKRSVSRANDRARMVRLAIAGHPQFALSTVELERSGKSYTVDTLCYFAARASADSYYFIIGIDAFAEIESWKNYAKVFSLCNFIVTSRPGFARSRWLESIPIAVRKLFCYVAEKKVYRHLSGTYVSFLQITDIAIASSDIRQRVANKKSIRYLVPSAVEAYIKRKGLYRKRVGLP